MQTVESVFRVKQSAARLCYFMWPMEQNVCRTDLSEARRSVKTQSDLSLSLVLSQQVKMKVLIHSHKPASALKIPFKRRWSHAAQTAIVHRHTWPMGWRRNHSNFRSLSELLQRRRVAPDAIFCSPPELIQPLNSQI